MPEHTTTALLRGICEELEYSVEIHHYTGLYHITLDSEPPIMVTNKNLPMALIEAYKEIEALTVKTTNVPQ